MSNITPDELARILERKNVYLASDSRGRRSSVIQKPKANSHEPQDRKAVPGDEKRYSSKEGVDHPRYRVTVTLRLSDRRRRDGDGCLATIMDALCDAVGRLTELDS